MIGVTVADRGRRCTSSGTTGYSSSRWWYYMGAFVATSIQEFGGDNSAILAVIAAVAGLLSNTAAARFEQKDHAHETGTLNAWFVGLVTAAALYVALNAIVFVVGLALLSEEVLRDNQGENRPTIRMRKSLRCLRRREGGARPEAPAPQRLA